jgi:hypothetical protein
MSGGDQEVVVNLGQTEELKRLVSDTQLVTAQLTQIANDIRTRLDEITPNVKRLLASLVTLIALAVSFLGARAVQ